MIYSIKKKGGDMPRTKNQERSKWIKDVQHLSEQPTKGLSIKDHHDRDYYRRVNAKTTSYQKGKGSKYRNDTLGADYLERHNRYKTKHDLQKGKNSGREWEDHKYLYKTKTKNGKVRYVYELPDKTKVSYEKDSVMDELAENSGRDKHHSNIYLKRRNEFDETYAHKLNMTVRELSKGRFNNARKFGKEFLQLTPTAAMLAGTRVKDATSDVIDYGRQFLKQFK